MKTLVRMQVRLAPFFALFVHVWLSCSRGRCVACVRCCVVACVRACVPCARACVLSCSLALLLALALCMALSARRLNLQLL
eukprot:2971170-Rhodomonas_salina.3